LSIVSNCANGPASVNSDFVLFIELFFFEFLLS
jgi:hypothetical protein